MNPFNKKGERRSPLHFEGANSFHDMPCRDHRRFVGTTSTFVLSWRTAFDFGWALNVIQRPACKFGSA